MRVARPTNAHHDEEAGQKAAKVDDAAAGALHEVVMVGGSAAYPVGQRGDDVGCSNKEREVILP